nr:MAG TPA: hypothetical protein [Caudoviricetes sp.]DAM24340.1 MAG TPA: hypothetical protein [Caudoviricetes sp.]
MSRLFILELRFPYNALQYFSYLSFIFLKKSIFLYIAFLLFIFVILYLLEHTLYENSK